MRFGMGKSFLSFVGGKLVVGMQYLQIRWDRHKYLLECVRESRSVQANISLSYRHLLSDLCCFIGKRSNEDDVSRYFRVLLQFLQSKNFKNKHKPCINNVFHLNMTKSSGPWSVALD
jgi:hypothetical protein